MSNYNQSLIIAGIAAGLTTLTGHWEALFVILGLLLVVLAIGSYRMERNFYFQSLNRVATDQKSIVLTFDDGPCPEITPQVLDILKEFGCQAVFFCIGRKIAGSEAILQRMVADGHLVANHSFSHSPLFDLYSSDRMLREIRETNEEIYRATGLRAKLFRPPYGVTNPMLAKAVQRSGLASVGWNKRSLDTAIKDNAKVLARISGNLRPGDIILLHDSVNRCPAVLREFLSFLRNTDYKVERLDKITYLECYEN
jgi:peptidoglycan/xylan/chitin deacetylase (PgdA/CDA1 family)